MFAPKLDRDTEGTVNCPQYVTVQMADSNVTLQSGQKEIQFPFQLHWLLHVFTMS